jgi:hypothetical protein
MERLREHWLLLLDRIPENVRYRIAEALNRLPGQCWPELVTWAMYGPSHKDRALPMSGINYACREDAARTGCCWCGKLRDPEGERRWDEHVARLDRGEASS